MEFKIMMGRSGQFRNTLFWGVLLLAAVLMLPQAAHAEPRANLQAYCKQALHSKNISARYERKQRAWKCTSYVTAMGFNTTYNKPVKYLWVKPQQVCRSQFGTDWSSMNSSGVYCRDRNSVSGRHSVNSGRNESYGSNASSTMVRFCNRNSEKIWFTIGYFANQRAGWRTEGWWSISPRSCIKHKMPDSYNGDIYVYAVNRNGREWRGSTGLCIKRYDGFSINNSDTRNCSRKGYERKLHSHFKVRPGLSTYNFN